jgi:Cu2+-exporting ATPase
MDLVPMEPTESEDNKAFLDLWRKMKIAIVLLPIFIIAMSEMIPNNPLLKIMDTSELGALSLPVLLGCFFVRAYKSVITWN